MATMMGKRGASAFKSKMGLYFFSLFSALQLSWIRSTEGSFFKGKKSVHFLWHFYIVIEDYKQNLC